MIKSHLTESFFFLNPECKLPKVPTPKNFEENFIGIKDKYFLCYLRNFILPLIFTSAQIKSGFFAPNSATSLYSSCKSPNGYAVSNCKVLNFYWKSKLYLR